MGSPSKAGIERNNPIFKASAHRTGSGVLIEAGDFPFRKGGTIGPFAVANTDRKVDVAYSGSSASAAGRMSWPIDREIVVRCPTAASR
jgi:hypothetical protein